MCNKQEVFFNPLYKEITFTVFNAIIIKFRSVVNLS